MGKREPVRGLRYVEEPRGYYLDGKRVPGATTIINVLDKPQLKAWAAGCTADYVLDNPDGLETLRDMGREAARAALVSLHKDVVGRAQDKGKEFHRYAEQLMAGDEVDVPDRHIGRVEATLQFADDWQLEPVLVEAPCASREHQYAGTLDLVARFTHPQHGTGVGIFDWKTGKRIYAAAVWQLTAYGYSEFHTVDGQEHPTADLGIERSFGVHIRDDGYDVHELPYNATIFAEFVHLREAYEINKRGAKYVGPSLTQQEN